MPTKTLSDEQEEPTMPANDATTASTAEVPIWGYELEDYLDIGAEGSSHIIKVTNLLSWDMADDNETYEPNYIDTKVKKQFVVGKSATISYEKDAYKNNDLDEFLMDHEDDTNIPVRIIRVRTWTKDGDGKMKAKAAKYNLTPSQLDKNTSGEPIKLKGELSMTDEDWTKGTWDGTAFAAE